MGGRRKKKKKQSANERGKGESVLGERGKKKSGGEELKGNFR